MTERPESFRRRATPQRPPGYHRLNGSSTYWSDPTGALVSDSSVLERLKALAIPPAWTDVWAASDSHARVQATGIDSRGRTQYRYSAVALAEAAEDKFAHMLAFADALPQLRHQVVVDLQPARAAVPANRVTAGVVRLLDRGLFRVGNERYTRDNHTHGLTTLSRQDVKVDGAKLTFDFISKEHVHRHVEVTDRSAASLITELLHMPCGHDELLFLATTAESLHRVDSTVVNAYVHAHTAAPASAKIFRTWGATVVAACVAAGAEYQGATGRHNAATAPVIAAAHLLGNSPAVAQHSYVHPDAIRVGRAETVQSAVHRAAVKRNSNDVRNLFHDDDVQRAILNDRDCCTSR